MKIHFLEVTGRVAIDDRFTMQDATTGTTLDTEEKQYVILTGDNSSARIIIESRTITMGANSFLYTSFSRPRQIRSSLQDPRFVCGKIWSMIDRGTLREDDTSTAAVGIRG